MDSDVDTDSDIDSDADYDSPFEDPRVRYAFGLGSGAILVAVAFIFLEGTIRWIILGLAIVEVLIVPQVLKLRSRRGAPPP